MVNCPNCGAAVASNQRFCGNCGTDVQAALSARATPVSDAQQSPYAYAQPSYGYDAGYGETDRRPNRMILVLAVLFIVACCMFFMGVCIGLEVIPPFIDQFLGPTPKPTPRVTPTPQTMLMLFNYLLG